MTRSFSPRSECLRIDPGCTSTQEPYVWPETPHGRTGTRWTVRDSKGFVIGTGDPGNPASAWRRAMNKLASVPAA